MYAYLKKGNYSDSCEAGNYVMGEPFWVTLKEHHVITSVFVYVTKHGGRCRGEINIVWPCKESKFGLAEGQPPAIPTTWETEAGGSPVQGQTGQS
jgi:hypothetical protein